MAVSQTPRTDDPDMVKLQKSFGQHRGRSYRAQSALTQLTPAEIRQLNNSVSVPRKRNGSSASNPRNGDVNTPPRTPDNTDLQHSSNFTRYATQLPTPPHLSDDVFLQRTGSTPRSDINLLSPIPQSHHKAGSVLLNTHNLRPASAASHRPMPTYRGPEITATGSYSMLHLSKRSNQIVDNPLSQFSRPRQSMSSMSPSRQESRTQWSDRGSSVRSYRSQSLPLASSFSDHINSPPSTRNSIISTISTLSSEVNEMEVLLESRPISPIAESSESTTVLARSQSDPVASVPAAVPRSRYRWSWRKDSKDNRGDTNDKHGPKKLRRKAVASCKISIDGTEAIDHEVNESAKVLMKQDSQKRPVKSDKITMPEENSVTKFRRRTDEPPYLEAQKRTAHVGSEQSNHMPAISQSISRGSGVQVRDSARSTTALHSEIAQPQSHFTPASMPVVNQNGDIIAKGSEPIFLPCSEFEESDRKLRRFSSLRYKERPQILSNSTKTTALTVASQPETNVYSRRQEGNRRTGLNDDNNGNVQRQEINCGVFDPTRDVQLAPNDLGTPALEEATGNVIASLNSTDLFRGEDSSKHARKQLSGAQMTDKALTEDSSLQNEKNQSAIPPMSFLDESLNTNTEVDRVNDDAGQSGNHQSTVFLPIPQFGKHFGRSSGTFKSYVLGRERVQNGVVRSTLAANNAS